MSIGRLAALAVGLGLGLSASFASAAEIAPFTPDAFAAAQKAGKPILVDIKASWCPTCHAQAPILGKLEEQAKFKDLVVLEVDFDTQKNVVRQFGARTQSTLIAYKGAKEATRSVGDTNPGSIATLLDATL
jgi:thiol-disulfide isomerase/thioredoxin